MNMAFIGNLRPTEIFIIAFVVLLLFGAKRLPEIARSMGKSIREFKKAATEMDTEFKSALKTEEKPKTPAAEPKEVETKA